MGQTVVGELVGFQESLPGASHFPLPPGSTVSLSQTPTSPQLQGSKEGRKTGKGLDAEWGCWSDVEFTWNAPGYFGKADILGKQ